MLISKRTAEPIRKTWKNQPASSLVLIFNFLLINSYCRIMAEIASLPKYFRTSSVSSASFAMRERTSMSMSPRSSSPVIGWAIQYKTTHDSEAKGVWDGYQTREEFLAMHLR